MQCRPERRSVGLLAAAAEMRRVPAYDAFSLPDTFRSAYRHTSARDAISSDFRNFQSDGGALSHVPGARLRPVRLHGGRGGVTQACSTHVHSPPRRFQKAESVDMHECAPSFVESRSTQIFIHSFYFTEHKLHKKNKNNKRIKSVL